jgi:hypothetical protein
MIHGYWSHEWQTAFEHTYPVPAEETRKKKNKSLLQMTRWQTKRLQTTWKVLTMLWKQRDGMTPSFASQTGRHIFPQTSVPPKSSTICMSIPCNAHTRNSDKNSQSARCLQGNFCCYLVSRLTIHLHEVAPPRCRRGGSINPR